MIHLHRELNISRGTIRSLDENDGCGYLPVMAEQDSNAPSLPPILAGKDFAAPSVFEPENLLREARRQKNVPRAPVPEVCLLDPDGDILRTLVKAGRTRRCAGWACYHTELHEFEHAAETFGIIACAVGASFAVLLAEQLFVSGCRFL